MKSERKENVGCEKLISILWMGELKDGSTKIYPLICGWIYKEKVPYQYKRNKIIKLYQTKIGIGFICF